MPLSTGALIRSVGRGRGRTGILGQPQSARAYHRPSPGLAELIRLLSSISRIAPGAHLRYPVAHPPQQPTGKPAATAVTEMRVTLPRATGVRGEPKAPTSVAWRPPPPPRFPWHLYLVWKTSASVAGISSISAAIGSGLMDNEEGYVQYNYRYSLSRYIRYD